MPKWFAQAEEIARLREENTRLRRLVAALHRQIGDTGLVDLYGVSDEERALACSGQYVAAVKAYRRRTGADLVTAKKAIDSVRERGQ